MIFEEVRGQFGLQGLVERRVDGMLLSPIHTGKGFEEFLLSLNILVVCLGNQISDRIVLRKSPALDGLREARKM